MKTAVIFSLISVVSFSFIHPLHWKKFVTSVNDSTVIAHVLDGSVAEWPAERFTQHRETTSRYAADNNASDLFFAISIASPAMQARIMQAGMTLFIDINGKKKESKGIEFPVINENSPDLPAERNPDVTVIRSMMILNLIKIKVFGFSDNASPYQELSLPGSVNVAYNWDSARVMHIEYRIPLSLLGDITVLNQKNISYGWKMRPSINRNFAATSSQVVAVPSNRRPPRPTNTNDAGSDRRNEEQQFWDKYVVKISK